MRPARLCLEMAAPTWLGRAPLHAAAISCCVLPLSRARALLLRLGELRLSPAVVCGRPERAFCTSPGTVRSNRLIVMLAFRKPFLSSICPARLAIPSSQGPNLVCWVSPHLAPSRHGAPRPFADRVHRCPSFSFGD